MLLDQEHTEEAKTLDIAPLTTIPENSISTWGYSFWAGTGGLFPETNKSTITVYVSNQVTSLQRQCILDTIYMRSTSGGTLSAQPSIETQIMMQETPHNVASLLTSSSGSEAQLQLLSGVITEDITTGWNGTIPHRLQQKLYRTLHKTIVLHQHGAWLKRNAVLHPDTDTDIPVDYGRKPARKRQIIEDEEGNPKDKRWTKQRKTAMIRTAMWEGTPIPKPSTKRSRDTSRNTSPITESGTSSETDEWPSLQCKRTRTEYEQDGHNAQDSDCTSEDEH
jgi:hypothetical protein